VRFPLRLATTVLLANLVASAPARAADAADDSFWIEHPTLRRSFTDAPFTVQGRVGFGTIVGLLGIAASYDVANRIALGAGIGANPSGPQLAGFVRLRPFTWENRRTGTLRSLALDVGFSTGPYSNGVVKTLLPGLDAPAPTRWDRINWVQWEIVYEVKAVDGFSFMLGAGQAWPVSYNGRTCPAAPDPCSEKVTLSFLPSGSLGIGHAF
jgi:hypothetical protein